MVAEGMDKGALLTAKTGGKSCVVRKDETGELLKTYEATRLLKDDGPDYNVVDPSTRELLDLWERRYKQSLSEYDFYCSQSPEDLHDISVRVQKKEAVAVANAAQAGLLAAEAAIRQKRTAQEKQNKHTAKMEEEHKEKAQKAESEANQKTNQLAANQIEKNTARLKALPQLTQDLYGVLMDASTGDPISDAKVSSKCLFTAQEGASRSSGGFTLANGVAGPNGRQCAIKVTKDGYAPSEFPVTVQDTETDGRKIYAMIAPSIADAKKFRFVLQWGSNPADLNAHVLVPVPGEQLLDVAAAPLMEHQSYKFDAKGSATELPFATLDHASAKGFGPETATVHNVNDGTYHFVVSNNNKAFTTKEEFKDSGARAFLYQGNKLINTVAIDTAVGEVTHTWSVYKLKCTHGNCQLVVHNTFLEPNTKAAFAA